MNDNLGIGVMSSVNFKERYTACKSTWLKDFDNTFIFGGHESSKVDDNLISIENAGEDWSSCFLKQQLGLKHMFEINSEFDWYCIVGCDNVMFKTKVLEELSKYDRNTDLFLSQPCGIWSDTPYLREIHSPETVGLTFRAVTGGAGFFISNSLMKKCYPVIEEFNQLWSNISGSNYGCADVGISYMMKKYFDIEMIHVFSMLSQSPDHYLDETNHDWYKDYLVPITELVKEPMSLHYIKPLQMKEVYESFKK